MRLRDDSDQRDMVTIGCGLALASALVTSLLLFVNGALVIGILAVFARSGPSWASNRELSQFLLFTLPVALVVVQWIMIDYVRTRFGPRNVDK